LETFINKKIIIYEKKYGSRRRWDRKAKKLKKEMGKEYHLKDIGELIILFYFH